MGVKQTSQGISAGGEDEGEESETVMNGKITETEGETETWLWVASKSEGKHSEEGNEYSETEGTKLEDDETEGTNIEDDEIDSEEGKIDNKVVETECREGEESIVEGDRYLDASKDEDEGR